MPIEEIHISPGVVEYRTPLTECTSPTTKTIAEVNLKPQDGAVCTIGVLGDLHGANVCHNEQLAIDTRNYFLDKKIPVISPGTDPEMPLRGSKSESWHLRYPPGAEIDKQLDFLGPLADAGLLLGLTDDNHGWRWANMLGTSFAEALCTRLGVPDAYLGWQGFMRLLVGDQSYDLFVFHGKSGAATLTGKMNAAMRLGQHYRNADIYITGHVHNATAYDECYLKPKDDVVGSATKLYVICGSFLNYFGLYAERMLLRPGKMGAKLIKLRADCKYATAEVGGYM